MYRLNKKKKKYTSIKVTIVGLAEPLANKCAYDPR